MQKVRISIMCISRRGKDGFPITLCDLGVGGSLGPPINMESPHHCFWVPRLHCAMSTQTCTPRVTLYHPFPVCHYERALAIRI